MSHMDEWARRRNIEEDVERDLFYKHASRRQAKQADFRKKHPWLARLLWGKG